MMINSTAPAPCFSAPTVKKIVRELYGINASVQQLESYTDQNFYLKEPSGKKFVFKIANHHEYRETLEFQNQALAFLAEQDRNLRCPAVVPSLNNAGIVPVTGPDEKVYWVRLLSYLPGRFLVQTRPHAPELLYQVGRFLGKLDKTLAHFFHPAAWRILPWDLRYATEMTHHTHNIAHPGKRRMVEYFLLQFETMVAPLLTKLRKSIIHNDANDYNLLILEAFQEHAPLLGIIDFGDMVYTCTVCELAIAATYIMMRQADPLEAVLPLIRGYHRQYPLLETELQVLFYLIAARLCISVIMSARQKQLEPHNHYLSVSEEPAWELLEKLIASNPERANRMFREACRLPSSGAPKRLELQEILALRQQHIGKSLSISYREPLTIVRGAMQYLFDERGYTYLDCVNNVCHVGHCHPRVVRAACQQMATLNTNTRYLHENLVQYTRRLLSSMPAPLSVCYLVNSGSEANELALRLAKAHTGQKDCIVVDNAYHGHSVSLIEISPYKFDGPGGKGAPAHVHKVTMPDSYRGLYRTDDPDAGEKYAADIRETIAQIRQQHRGLAAFICESLLSCGGQIVLPNGYLQSAYRWVREAGGVCIADEVQVGFGRVGSHFWGFETQGVVPDIVTLGKPIGNGHPLGAVITTPEIAESFYNGMEYFNTFGGNPVSCAVGLAVLETIEEEQLQENALQVGAYLKEGLLTLQNRHPQIGDIRGMGLFLGIELVTDRETMTPATTEACELINRMKEQRILLSTDGPFDNVIKIKPPMVFSQVNADMLVNTLDRVLRMVFPASTVAKTYRR